MFNSPFQDFSETADPSLGAPRLKRLRASLRAQKLDGFLVPRANAHQNEYVAPCEERLAWLTGFTGSAGFAIVLRDKAALFVDGRYTIQAREQVDAEAFAVLAPEKNPVTDGWRRTRAGNRASAMIPGCTRPPKSRVTRRRRSARAQNWSPSKPTRSTRCGKTAPARPAARWRCIRSARRARGRKKNSPASAKRSSPTPFSSATRTTSPGPSTCAAPTSAIPPSRSVSGSCSNRVGQSCFSMRKSCPGASRRRWARSPSWRRQKPWRRRWPTWARRNGKSCSTPARRRRR